MRALWWDGKAGKLTYVSDAVEPIVKEAGDVKIKVAFSGVCGSDFHYMAGEMGKCNVKDDGLIMGHEFSGVIVDKGSGVDNLEVGDEVCINPNVSCGSCEWCSKARPHFCNHMKPLGRERNGGWAEYCVTEQKEIHKLPSSVSLNSGALCEPYSCVLRGWNMMKELPSKSSRILIQGAGIIGSIFACLCHLHGFRDVTISEPHGGRRESCQKLGLDYRVVVPETLVDEARQNDPDTHGYEAIFDCTGNCKAVEKTIDFAKRGAFICMFGCCPAGDKIQIEPFQIYWKELRITGSFTNPFCFEQAIDVLVDMKRRGLLEFDKIGVEVFELSQYKEAFASLKSGSAAKAMFKL